MLIGVCATGLLFVAGYLYGARQGIAARRAIRGSLESREAELEALRGRLAQQERASDGASAELRQDLGKMLAPLVRQGEAVQRLQGQLQGLSQALEQRDAAQQALKSEMQQYLKQMSARPADLDTVRKDLQRMLAPVIERERHDEDLRATVQQLLSPLMQRERLDYELSRLDLGSGTRGELPRLLDGIAQKGGFSTVLLSDEAGLPIASNSNARELERLAGLSSLTLLLADRMTRENAPAPLAVLVHDDSNQIMLNRLFQVAGQRLLLTAVSSGSNITTTALDPALAKLDAVLAGRVKGLA